MWLTVSSGIIQVLLMAGGIYVSLRPQADEHHVKWIALFVVAGLLGVAVTGFQAWDADQNQSELKKQIGELLEQGKNTGAGVQYLQKSADSLSSRPIIIQPPTPTNERDRLCERKVAYKVTPHPLPAKPYNQRMTISKPRTVLYKLRVVSSSDISINMSGGIGTVESGRRTADYLEPITDISIPSGIRDEYTIDFDSPEHSSIKCVGMVN